MAYSATGHIGANTSRRTTHREQTLRTPLIGNDGNTYLYVQASGAIAAAAACTVDASGTATSGAGAYTADAAFVAGEYGWVRKTASPL